MVAIWLDDTVCNYRDKCLYVHGYIANMSWQWLSGIYFMVGAQLPLIKREWFQADACSNRKMTPSVLQNYLISPDWWRINAFLNVPDGGTFSKYSIRAWQMYCIIVLAESWNIKNNKVYCIVISNCCTPDGLPLKMASPSWLIQLYSARQTTLSSRLSDIWAPLTLWSLNISSQENFSFFLLSFWISSPCFVSEFCL